MKNKTTTYALIVVVLLLWGYIVYKIYAGVSGDETPEATVVRSKPQVKESIALKVEDYTLNLNYRDPFLGKAAQQNVERPKVTQRSQQVRPLVQRAPVPPPEVIDWSFIQFKGIMKNPTSQKIVSIVIINNAQYMLEEGAIGGGVKVIKVYKDSLKVSYKNIKKTITR